jgi:hypothetical protein
LWAALCPDPPREIPHSRFLNVSCRTVHLAAFGLLLGGHGWGVEADRLLVALWATIGSGLALMLLECLPSARWFFEGRGLLVLLKLGLLLLVPLLWEYRLSLLLAVVAVASVGSHMPARFRHASLLSIWSTAEAKAKLAATEMTGCGRITATGLSGKGEWP